MGSNETVIHESGKDTGYLEGYKDRLSTKVEKLTPIRQKQLRCFMIWRI